MLVIPKFDSFRNCVNLLNNVPSSRVDLLFEPARGSLRLAGEEPVFYENTCVDVPKTILTLLMERIDEVKFQGINGFSSNLKASNTWSHVKKKI